MSVDPDRPDLATRLVGAIKSAMGLSRASDGQSAAQGGIAAPPWLRAIFIGAAAVMLALWAWGLSPAIRNWNNPNEDGFSLVPAVYGSITLLPLGLIMLLGVVGRGKNVQRARIALVIAIALMVMMLTLAILARLNNATGA
jgi:hypothetical protein